MTETELYWLAGWLEGEGCFMTSGGTATISICSTDLDVIQKVVTLLGGAPIREHSKVKESHKQAYVATVFAQQAADIMERILPLMGLRRQAKIREVLEHRAGIPARKSAAGKLRWSDPAFKEKNSRAIQKALADPDTKRLKSENMKRLWDDPEKREKMLLAQKRWRDGR